MASTQPDQSNGNEIKPQDQPGSSSQTSQSQDYDGIAGFTRLYLQTYYSGAPSIDEIAINKFIIRELKRLNRNWYSYVEVSGEGGAKNMTPYTPYVQAICSTDFRADARDETRKWAEGSPDAFSWNHYIGMSLKHEGIEPTNEAVAQRIAEMRSKINRIEACNVLETPIVDTSKVPLTSNTITGVFFVSGEVGETVEGWKRVMENISRSIAPGGQLMMSALRGMQEYEVHRPDGSIDTYPCAELYGHHFRELLPILGFSNVVVEELEIPEHERDVGLPGVIMLSATKVST